MDRIELAIEEPLDLRRTLRPLDGRFRRDGWWLTARTPEGPGSLRVSRKESTVIGDAWGEGSTWLLDRLAGIVGLGDDPLEFETDHPLVSELHRARPGWRFGRTDLVFSTLIGVICAQKVTGTEAVRAIRGLYRVFSSPAPGPVPLSLPPDPVAMAEAPYWDYHELHLEKKRADVIRRVARDAASIDQLASLPSHEAAAALRRYNGIAEWTTASTLEVSHGDADAVAVGDYHLKNIVVYHLTGRPRGTDEEMLELLEEFRPHRGRVVRLLLSLGRAPAYGPRSTPRNFTRM